MALVSSLNPPRMVAEPAVDDERRCKGYLSLVESRLASDDAKYLYRFGRQDLIDRSAWLVLAVHPRFEQRVCGGLYTHMDEDGWQWIRGAVVDPAHRGAGLMGRLLLGALALPHFAQQRQRGARAAVRVLPGGQVNGASARTFQRLTFQLEPKTRHTPLRMNDADAHLFPWSIRESGGERVLLYRLVSMSAKDCDAVTKDFHSNRRNSPVCMVSPVSVSP